MLRTLLLNGPQGYNELLASVAGISSKELTRNLRELAESGLVTRSAEVSSRLIRYHLTPAGEGLMPTFQSLLTWGQQTWYASLKRYAHFGALTAYLAEGMILYEGRLRGAFSQSLQPRNPEGALTMPAAAGTKQNPWTLKTPPGTAEFQAYREPSANPPALVVQVGKTELRYDLRCLEDLQEMLKTHGDWMLLGSVDEQKPAADGTVEAWARSTANPVGGWYGLKKGLRGRFAMYVPPVMKVLGMAEVQDNPRNNRMRAL